MKKIMVFGTFDIFHKGHKNFLRQARRWGEHLTVIIARDKTVKETKAKEPRNSERKRLTIIKKSGLASRVVLGKLDDKYAVIKKYKPDVICLGYDQIFFIGNLESKLKSFGLNKTKIIHLDAYKPEIYKSSKIMK